ncbi:MAG: hypothetical protein JNL48_22215 [Acidobacteria bacterium]|nr:hypothetical protein [Acidobacteriota bacterium]
MIDAARPSPPSPARALIASTARRRSPLAGPDRYAAAAAHLRPRIRAGAVPDPRLFAGAWSSRARRTISLLALALRAEGVAASGLRVRAALGEAARVRPSERR